MKVKEKRLGFISLTNNLLPKIQQRRSIKDVMDSNEVTSEITVNRQKRPARLLPFHLI